MPRQSRTVTPGALHHIIVRGNKRRMIFRDDEDRRDCTNRSGGIPEDTTMASYAWALIPNEFLLLLQPEHAPIPKVIRRMLMGHAARFYRHHLYLFQNRYKSVLCQENAYLLEMVRYMYLNPSKSEIR